MLVTKQGIYFSDYFKTRKAGRVTVGGREGGRKDRRTDVEIGGRKKGGRKKGGRKKGGRERQGEREGGGEGGRGRGRE